VLFVQSAKTNVQDGVCDCPGVHIIQIQKLHEDHLGLRQFSTKQDTNTCTRATRDWGTKELCIRDFSQVSYRHHENGRKKIIPA